MRSHGTRRSFLKGFAGFSSAVLLHACTSANSRSTSGANENSEPIKVGLNVGNIPWEFRTETGELVGFEVDLLQEVGKRLERAVEFVDTPFTALFPAVLSSRIHAAVSSITITTERLKTLDFAQPYYDSDQSLTVRTDRGIQSLADLRNKIVAVDSASTGDAWAQQHMEEYGFAEIVRYEGLVPAMADLESGQFDGYISDIPSLLYYTKDRASLQVVERIPTGEQYSIMFAKGSPLRDEMNAVITALKQDGTLAQIHQKWFGAAPESGTSTAEVRSLPRS
ncbi:ABC transporter substrate-binding protein [Egbenema bharatensis]|uniref:ABC transporter substrate-binding protein n=1 Tax=Egbenema bharatensis TaxID=3463334 RepID=UPI003A837D90